MGKDPEEATWKSLNEVEINSSSRSQQKVCRKVSWICRTAWAQERQSWNSAALNVRQLKVTVPIRRQFFSG